MRKVVVGATALMLLASVYAYAQQPPGGRDGGRRWQPRAEDRAAFLDARLAALHAGLKLTPDQEKFWPDFEQAYRELAALRGERLNATRDDGDRASDPIHELVPLSKTSSTPNRDERATGRCPSRTWGEHYPGPDF